VLESAITVDAADLAFRNHRCFPRQPPRGSATIIADETPLSQAVCVTLRNISQGGVSFIVDMKLAVGQQITVNLLALALLRPLIMQAQVRWVDFDIKPGMFRVGCSWVKRLGYAHIINFV
jgi:hypothetical protein